MLKEIYDRLGYALIGLVFGAILGLGVWFLYDAGLSVRMGAPEIHLGLFGWVKVLGGGFALLGFLFKADAGAATGGTVREIHDYEARKTPALDIPGWLAIALCIAIAASIWHWIR